MRVFVQNATHGQTRDFTVNTLAGIATVDLELARLISKECDLVLISRKEQRPVHTSIAIAPREEGLFSKIKVGWAKVEKNLSGFTDGGEQSHPILELWDSEKLESFIQSGDYSKVYAPARRKGKLLFYNVSAKTQLFDFVIEPDKTKFATPNDYWEHYKIA